MNHCYSNGSDFTNPAIQCQDTAFREFQKHLYASEYTKVVPIATFNKGRHRLIQADDKLFYCIYKREFYNTFYKEFDKFHKENPEYSEKGESINKESLDLTLRKGIYQIVFLHPDAKYTIFPMLIKRFCEKHTLIRVQLKYNSYKGLNGYKEQRREPTYSFPKNILQKI